MKYAWLLLLPSVVMAGPPTREDFDFFSPRPTLTTVVPGKVDLRMEYAADDPFEDGNAAPRKTPPPASVTIESPRGKATVPPPPPARITIRENGKTIEESAPRRKDDKGAPSSYRQVGSAPVVGAVPPGAILIGEFFSDVPPHQMGPIPVMAPEQAPAMPVLPPASWAPSWSPSPSWSPAPVWSPAPSWSPAPTWSPSPARRPYSAPVPAWRPIQSAPVPTTPRYGCGPGG